MTLFLRKLHLRAVCTCPYVKSFVTGTMPKQSAPKPPEKKLKSSQDETSITKNAGSAEQRNLGAGLVPADETEDAGKQEGKSQVKVEYLDTPVKSANDKKEYRVIRLENGLTALLIADLHSAAVSCAGDDADSTDEEDDETEDSEEDASTTDDEGSETEGEEDDTEKGTASKRLKREEKMAACGLCVGVGSFSDPPEIPGMAHFLEHMVFMGSEKYPQENDFDAFIKKKGGSSNASTDCEQTTFYFEVQEKHLLPAMDRFAQFFIRPLMKRDAITRERESVESEFQMAVPCDFSRREQLFCSFAKTRHPATKFTWGNLVTLRDNVSEDKLYEELHKFRERHYSAHRMTLAVQARLPLYTLEEYVKQCFANVPSNGLLPDDFNDYKGANSFDTPSFRRIYKIKPIQDLCQVQLTWVMPPMHALYKSKPHEYVSWIIGHEGKGSLSSYLRKKMWCLEIVAGNEETGFEHSSMYALFRIYLNLTEEGYKNLKEVLDSVFSYINMLHKEGPQKRIYDEVHQIDETDFRFMDEEPPVEFVEDLCENMHFFPPEHYISGTELYFEYNPDAIKNCLDHLTPDDVNIMIFNKQFNEEEFDKVEPWFKTKYTDTEIPKKWIEDWRTIEPLPEFHLPLPNVFITNDFDLIDVPANVPAYPTKIHSDDISEIWYRPDPKFKLPECYMYIYLISPLTLASPQNAAMTNVFVGVLKQLLSEELYPATVAGLNEQIYTGDKGIVIKVDGYNQNLPLFLTTITRYVADCRDLVTKDLFDVMKTETIKSYYNKFLKPAKLAKELRLSLLMDVYWSAVDKHAAISDVEFEQFQSFVRHFADHIYVQCLVQGNMAKEDVVSNVKKCVEILSCGPLLPDTMPQLKVVEIPLGSHYCKISNFNKQDVNSVVANYYQSGVASIKLAVIIELLIMIMEEPLFNQLRTQEQLGYDVFCLMRDTFGVLGYSVTVCTQADRHSTGHVDDRIEEFLKSFKRILDEISEKELDGMKESLTKLKQCADVHLGEEMDRNWAEITSGDYMFDRFEKEIAVIKDMNIDELRAWLISHTLEGSNLRKVSLQIVGAVPCIEDISDDNNENAAPRSGSPDLAVPAAERKEKYELEYLTDKYNYRMTAARNYITDIREYKCNLPIYSIKRPILS